MILDRWESMLYSLGEPKIVTGAEYYELIHTGEVTRENGEVLTIDDGPFLISPTEEAIERGGPGSGHHGHAGRPGEVGGSEPGEEGTTSEGKAYRGGTIVPLTLAEQGRIQQAIDYFGKDYDPALAISASGEAPEGKFPILDPDTGEVVWLTGGREPVLSHVEDQFRDSQIEHLTIINPNGTLVLRIDGNADTVPVTSDDVTIIQSEVVGHGREIVMTHNHPGWGSLGMQSSFSGVDVQSGMKYGFSEIRATTKNGTYYMRFSRQPDLMEQDGIMTTAHLAIETEIEIRGFGEFEGIDDPNTLTEVQQEAYHDGIHAAWTAVSEMFPDEIEYGFEERKEND